VRSKKAVLGAESMPCAAHVYMTPTQRELGANKSRNVPVWGVRCTQSDLPRVTRIEHDHTQAKTPLPEAISSGGCEATIESPYR